MAFHGLPRPLPTFADLPWPSLAFPDPPTTSADFPHELPRPCAAQASALAPLLSLLKDKAGASRRAREYVAGALMNLTLKQPSTQAEVAKAGAIPLLVEMLNEKVRPRL